MSKLLLPGVHCLLLHDSFLRPHPENQRRIFSENVCQVGELGERPPDTEERRWIEAAVGEPIGQSLPTLQCACGVL